jgi:hypothetical protein
MSRATASLPPPGEFGTTISTCAAGFQSAAIAIEYAHEYVMASVTSACIEAIGLHRIRAMLVMQSLIELLQRCLLLDHGAVLS